MKSTFVKVTALATLLLTISCGGKDSKKKEETKATPEVSASLEIEKPQLTFGFIKLTDMAPLAIAKETPSIAFAPNFDLLGVPSNSIIN